MQIDIHWDDDAQTVIRVDIHPYATWDEFHLMVDRVIWAMRTVSHRVDIIFNVEGKPSGNPIPHLPPEAATFAENVNLGMVVTTSEDNALTALHSVIMRILGVYKLDAQRSAGYFSTVEDARRVLYRMRETMQVA
jgi:hypothetical protein